MAVKRKNAINEPLFTHPPETVDDLNPYARIIADEAMRRGIWVEVLDAEAGEMRLSHGGRSVITRESLSEFTSAVAMESLRRQAADPPPGGRGRHRGAAAAGWPPSTSTTTNSSPRSATSWSSRRAASRARASPSASSGPDELDTALARAREQHPEVLIEQRAPGDDLRLVVIDGKVVAAALRRPAEIVGTGHHTVRELIEAQSRRRAAATGGESRIPIDEVTESTVAEAGWSVRRRAARRAAPAGAPDREPAPGRHHSRRDGRR